MWLLAERGQLSLPLANPTGLAQQFCALRCAGEALGENGVPADCSTGGQSGSSPATKAPQLQEPLIADRPGLSGAEASLVQRFDPSGPRHTIGFFIARFRKRAPG